ncbi:MAG: OmpA family protein [Leptospiraceae bacterium]|nr:OmpA family protein [Leptospiraceae bacterium]
MTIYYDEARYELNADQKRQLRLIAPGLKQIQGYWIVIQGHTNSKGSAEYNYELSRKRAQLVKEYLVQLGVPSELISPDYYGESRLVEGNSPGDQRQLSRRVRILLQKR